MSNTTRAIVMFANFLAALVGISWVASRMGGYSLGHALAFVFGTYLGILLAYACYRRLGQRVRLARAKRTRQQVAGASVEGREP